VKLAVGESFPGTTVIVRVSTSVAPSLSVTVRVTVKSVGAVAV
jgi:hypothetical protein